MAVLRGKGAQPTELVRSHCDEAWETEESVMGMERIVGQLHSERTLGCGYHWSGCNGQCRAESGSLGQTSGTLRGPHQSVGLRRPLESFCQEVRLDRSISASHPQSVS